MKASLFSILRGSFLSAGAMVFTVGAASVSAQSLSSVLEEECVYGDCASGRGTLALKTQWGPGEYVGNFRDGEFHGYGRLEIPISFTEREVYVGNWVIGIREGRGTHWNGKGKLYIGQWENNKRNGQGSYIFNLPRWNENEHSEFWLKENFENYSGSFVDDHYQGQGTYRWPGGQKYVGGFFASSKHGLGTYYYQTGTGRQQYWNYGDLIR